MSAPSDDVIVTLTYAEEEAREVARAFLYFTSNVSATHEDHDRMTLIRESIKRALPQPKPDEPQGLGAVVEDAEGCRWARARNLPPDDLGHDWVGGVPARWSAWSDIAAVRVLSEGVVA